MMDGIMATPGTICNIRRRGVMFNKTPSQTNFTNCKKTDGKKEFYLK